MIPKVVRKNHPCLGFSNILDRGVLILPSFKKVTGTLRGFYKVPDELVPTTCHVGIPIASLSGSVLLTPEQAYASASALGKAFLQTSTSSTNEGVTRDWHSAYNSLRFLCTSGYLGGAVAQGFWTGPEDGFDVESCKPVRSRLQDSDLVLSLRGAKPVSVEYHPSEGIPPCVMMWPCALIRWSFFDAFRKHYASFPDPMQQKRAEKLVSIWSRPTLQSLGYAAWVTQRVAGLAPPDSVLSEQVEFCLSRGGKDQDFDYPYLRGRQ